MTDAAENNAKLRRALMSVMAGRIIAVESFGHRIDSTVVGDHPSPESPLRAWMQPFTDPQSFRAIIAA